MATGLVAGSIGVGALTGALLVARVGTHPRAGLLAGIGLAATAVGAVGLVLAPNPIWGTLAGLVDGLGLAMFIAHAGPVVVAWSPATHLSRMQALLGVVQSITLVATNVLVGLLASALGAAGATLVVAAALAVRSTRRGHPAHDGPEPERRRTGIEPAWPRSSATSVLKTAGATRHPYASPGR